MRIAVNVTTTNANFCVIYDTSPLLPSRSYFKGETRALSRTRTKIWVCNVNWNFCRQRAQISTWTEPKNPNPNHSPESQLLLRRKKKFYRQQCVVKDTISIHLFVIYDTRVAKLNLLFWCIWTEAAVKQRERSAKSRGIKGGQHNSHIKLKISYSL